MHYQKKIAIIGGGITGITAAWLLEKNHDVHLFEGQASLGGDAFSIPITYNQKNIGLMGAFT